MTVRLRRGARLTLNSTLNVISNDVDGRRWVRLSWVVQDQHEAKVAAAWQHLVPRRAQLDVALSRHT